MASTAADDNDDNVDICSCNVMLTMECIVSIEAAGCDGIGWNGME